MELLHLLFWSDIFAVTKLGIDKNFNLSQMSFKNWNPKFPNEKLLLKY